MVDALIRLNSLLRIYEANFLNLHWNAVGEDFNDSHKGISTDYYELCNKYVDITAEMITRLGRNPLNYKEVLEFMESNADEDNEVTYDEKPVGESGYSKLLESFEDNKSTGIYIVDSDRFYTRKDIIEASDKMLVDVLMYIEEVLATDAANAPANIGIKSDLEAMHSEFDLQARYINKRRMM